MDLLLLASVTGALLSASLCYMSLEMNDLRLLQDRGHGMQLAAFFVYRLLELSARLTLLALFSVSLDCGDKEGNDE
jgi:hypothetical protein